ncbi:MAG TPA: hypothetical protein VF502_20370 [Stellaceae bacterium]
MRAVGTILRELVGLFIDDGTLALAALIWIALCALILPRVLPSSEWDGAILFLGLAAVLAENVLRGARRGRN